MEENQELRSEVRGTQWPNWVTLNVYLEQEVDENVSWQWDINTVWIRLDE